jgi:hypothetical protein
MKPFIAQSDQDALCDHIDDAVAEMQPISFVGTARPGKQSKGLRLEKHRKSTLVKASRNVD